MTALKHRVHTLGWFLHVYVLIFHNLSHACFGSHVAQLALIFDCWSACNIEITWIPMCPFWWLAGGIHLSPENASGGFLSWRISTIATIDFNRSCPDLPSVIAKMSKLQSSWCEWPFFPPHWQRVRPEHGSWFTFFRLRCLVLWGCQADDLKCLLWQLLYDHS